LCIDCVVKAETVFKYNYSQKSDFSLIRPIMRTVDSITAAGILYVVVLNNSVNVLLIVHISHVKIM